MDIESKLEGKRVYGDAFDRFERVAGNLKNHFECSISEHIMHLARRPKAIAQAANRYGKMIWIFVVPEELGTTRSGSTANAMWSKSSTTN